MRSESVESFLSIHDGGNYVFRILFLVITILVGVDLAGRSARADSAGAQSLFEEAFSALQRNDLARAESLFREGLKQKDIEPKFQGLASYYLAETLRLQNKSTPEAVQYYQEVIRLIPDTTEGADAAKKVHDLLALPATPPPNTGDRPTTLSFLWNGGWDGKVTAYQWGGINTAQAWAIGRISDDDLREICSAQGAECVRRLGGRAPTEIFANCDEGVAWQKAYPDRYRLSELVAGTRPDSHRAQATVGTWFALLCPKRWSNVQW